MENTQQVTPDVPTEPTAPPTSVTYEQYRVLLDEKKKTQQKLTDMEARIKQETDKKLAEQGNYQKLYEEEKARAKQFSEKFEKTQTEISSLKEDLAKGLPGDVLKAFDIKSMSLQQIQILVDKFSKKENVTSPGTKPVGDGIDEKKIFEDYTEEDLGKLFTSNPTVYNKLQTEFFNRQIGNK